MEEDFLQWISIIPGVGPQRARRLKEAGLTTPEAIRSASIEEIAQIEGIGKELAQRLKDYAEEIVQLKEEEAFLFLCPECGAFISKTAKRCEVCGATIEEGEPDESALAPEPELVDEEEETPELFICPACGRFIGRDVRSCPHCGSTFEEEPERDEDVEKLMSELEKQLEELDEDIKTPLEDLEEYLEEEPLEPEAKEKKAITKDFLKAWKRVSEGEEEEGTRRLEEELRHYDSLLDADPTLQRAWEKKAIILVELGRLEEAIDCYDMLAELSPDKEEEYKLEVLNLVKEKEGLKATPIEEEEEQPIDEKEEIEKAIAHYDELLRIDPTLKQAWQTRGELLEKVGRHEEAVASYDKAIECSKQERLHEIMDLASLRKKGMMEGRTSSKALIQRLGRTNGLVNGIVNGRTNGRVNGMVNGKTNGLVNGKGRVNGMVNGKTNGLVNGKGRVNGMVNGLVDGLVNGRGRVNGMVNGLVNGLVNGMGRVNGLVNGLINGNGLVNGRGSKHMPRFGPRDPRWQRALGGIAAVMSILIVVPLLFGLISPPAPPSPIKVDGSFDDWARVQSFADGRSDQTINPDVNVVSYKAEVHRNTAFVYASVEGVMLNGSGSQGVDTVYVFIDKDNDPSTGYSVAGLGADSMIEIGGWNNSIVRSGFYSYIEGPNKDDWNSFRRVHRVSSAIGTQEVETAFGVNGVPDPKIFVTTLDNLGNFDFSDTIVSPDRDVLKVVQTTIAPEVIPVATQTHFLKIDLDTRNGGAHISQINVTKSGDVSDSSVVLDLGIDNDGDQIPDQPVSQATFIQNVASFAADLEVVGGMTLIASVVLSNVTPSTVLGLSLGEVTTNATVSILDEFITSVYLESAPTVTIDGAFGDWTPSNKVLDGNGDVVMKGQAAAWINENVDLRSFAVDVSTDASFYVNVDGRMLGGVDIPVFRQRSVGVVPVIDSDQDSVPDEFDRFDFDFNNDAIPDSQTGNDVDGDSVLDYPFGTDYWLNTTIPPDFTAEYANRDVSIFIGPLFYPVLMGLDTLSVYLDSDNDTATGLPMILGTQMYGMDNLIAVSGRNGRTHVSGLYQHIPGNIPWGLVEGVSQLAFDTRSVELSVPLTSIQLSPGFKAVFSIMDWQSDFDVSDQATGRSRSPSTSTRSPAGDNVVINEVYAVTATGEWFELANPTSNAIDLNNWEVEIKSKGKWTTIHTFGAVSIGAWLSGSEYLDVDLPQNSIKDKPVDIRLLDSTGTVVDYTKLPKLKQGESWARLKDETDGKPEDTDSDPTDWYVSLSPTKGKYNDRKRPIIVVEKTANTGTGAPGDLITYTIYYNNTGDGISKDIWINDTLPSEVTFVSSSETPVGSSGNTYYWEFTNAAPGSSNSFTVTVKVNDGLTDGAQFNNFVRSDYTDVFRQPMEWSSSNKTMVVERPVITVSKIADVTDAGPGDTITYTIYYNNTGNGTAAHVWVNDTIPIFTTFSSSSVPFESQFGLTYVFHFYDVAPGANSFTISVTVNMTAPDGIDLVNLAVLDYTTINDYPLERSSDTALVHVPEFDAFLIPIISVALIFMWKKKRAKKSEEKNSEKE
jgi:uncharacterized repeat protein (TIGR01451 family)